MRSQQEPLKIYRIYLRTHCQNNIRHSLLLVLLFSENCGMNREILDELQQLNKEG